MADVKALAENLVGLTVKEVQELAEFLKTEYGIEPAAAAAGSIPYSDFKNSANSCTSFTVKPTKFSANAFTSAIMFVFFPASHPLADPSDGF